MNGKNSIEITKRYCVICNADITMEHHNAKMCKRCSIIKNGTLNDLISYDSSILDDMKADEDYVRCPICGYYATNLTSHIVYQEKMKMKDFRQQYPDSKIMCDKEYRTRSAKMKGSNNPGYQHGGKLSPFSTKSGRKQSDIDEAKKKAAANRKYTAQLDYWIEKTNGDVSKAKDLLHERQRTFVYSKLVERYGDEEKALMRWKERQDKWMQSLMSKSPDEKADIARKKLTSSRAISKPEMELYTEIKKAIPEVIQQIALASSDMACVFDMGLKRKLIEFNGDYWHANPKRFKADDILYFYGGMHHSAHDIWERDARKIAMAESMGYDVLTVWENDYKANKQAVIQDCIEYLLG